ncbi:MAG TPA: type III pantothenate kinase [Actinomycetota bacterium]|nr:type III pantothenate kinase [Actinomycetota bacterium]
MLLAVDVGNTEIVLGVFRGQELADHWRISSRSERTADELAHLFGGLLEHAGLSFSREVSGVVISSVVPSSTQALREMTERYFGFEPVVVEPGTRTGMAILIDNPREVGADRIVNSLAAFSRYGGPCIVVDFGTATNFDVVSARGEYLGGAIGPGLQVAAESLYAAAARLTRVELRPPRSVIGKNTVEAVQSGVLFGAAAEVDGMIERIRKELGNDAKTIATGGLAGLVISHCRNVDEHDPWLTLEGLRLVFEKNVSPGDE